MKFFVLPLMITVHLWINLSAYPEHGISTSLQDDQGNFPHEQLQIVSGWEAKSNVQYIHGVRFDGTTITITKSGIYYLSFHFILKSAFGTTSIRLIINDDVTFLPLSSDQRKSGTDVSGATFLKLLIEDKIDLRIKSNNANFRICKGSSLFFRFHNYATSSLGFYFALDTFIKVTEQDKVKNLDNWVKRDERQFHATTAFRQGANSFRIPMSGVYIILANIVILNLSIKKVFVQLNLLCDSKLLAYDFNTFHEIGNSFTLRLHENVFLNAESNILLQIRTNGTVNVLDVSTWSAILASDGSEDVTSFRYELARTENITVIDRFPIPISNWVKRTGNEATFGIIPLVNDASFNVDIANFFYVGTHLVVEIVFNKTEGLLYNFTVALAHPTDANYAEKIINIDQITEKTANNLSVFRHSVGLCGVFELSKTTPLSVTVYAPYAKYIRVYENSSFSVVKVPEYYPGFYAYTENQNLKTTKNYTSVDQWTVTNLGNYDFTNSFDANKGIYKVPTDGVYLIASNAVVNEISDQIYLLISVNADLNFDSGIYALEENPPLPATLNVAGFFDLKAGDDVRLYFKTNRDENWKISSTGLTACFFGLKPVYVQTRLSSEIAPNNMENAPYALSGWPGDVKNYQIKVGGVYFMYANIIFKYTTMLFNNYFKIYVTKNNVEIPGLKAYRSKQTDTSQQNNQFTLFFSGTFHAEKDDVIKIYVDHGLPRSYTITTQSIWGLILATATDISTAELITGAATILKNKNNFNAKRAWKTPGEFEFKVLQSNGLYRQGDINTDEEDFVQVNAQGIYLITANVELIQSQFGDEPIQVAVVINGNDGFENGLLVQQKSKWSTISLHVIGALLLNKGDKVSVKVFKGSNGLIVIEKELGFSILSLPEPQRPTSFAASWKQPFEIFPPGRNLSEFVFSNDLSSENVDWTTGLMKIVNDGNYMFIAELLFKNTNPLIENLTVSVMKNNQVHKTFTSSFLDNSTTISIYERMELSYGDMLQLKVLLLYNETLLEDLYNDYVLKNQSSPANVTLINPYDQLSLKMLANSTFSLVYLLNSDDFSSAKTVSDQSIDTNTELIPILNGWLNPENPGADASKYHVKDGGAYLLAFTYSLEGVQDTVQIAFTSDDKLICSTQHACVKSCSKKSQLTCLAYLSKSENVDISMKTSNPVMLGNEAERSIFFIHADPSGFKVGLPTPSLLSRGVEDWVQIGDWSQEYSGHASFLKDVVLYREKIILRKSGTYSITAVIHIRRKTNAVIGQASANQNSRKRRSIANATIDIKGTMTNFTGNGTNITTTMPPNITTTHAPLLREPVMMHVCIEINNECDASFLRSQEMSDNTDVATVNIVGDGTFIKWNIIRLIVKHSSSNEDFEVLPETFMSSVITEDVPFSRVTDPGPIMPSTALLPSNYSTWRIGIEKNWTCNAYGDGDITFNWYKNDRKFLTQTTGLGVLSIPGDISDTGRYYCQAAIGGFEFKSDPVYIDIYDIHECDLGMHNCSQNGFCTNTDGSYICTCRDGYNGDGILCENINECNTSVDVCMNNSVCIDTVPGYNCSCIMGYQGDDPKNEDCIDFDECQSNTTNNCHVTSADCINTIGSFVCQCKSGFSGNGVNCTDIDECENANDFCPQQSTCTNQVGNYTCECNQGYQFNETVCQDMNECIIYNATELCPNADNVCENTDGGYRCVCQNGYTGDSDNCQDINECDGVANDLCSINAYCINEQGSYRCQCKNGYSGSGKTCSDINECSVEEICGNGTCTNLQGSYLCSCYEGYSLQPDTCKEIVDGTTAAQTDACSIDPNSFKCVCNDPNKRKNNILCNGLFVALIILVLVAFVVLIFVIKYIKSRKLMKIRPAKVHKDKYIEMENESEL